MPSISCVNRSLIALLLALVSNETALAGLGFDGPRKLNTDESDDFDDNFKPQIATDGLGNWVTVWQQRYRVTGVVDPELFVSRSTDNGATWAEEALLHPDDAVEGRDDNAQIAADGTGTFVVVWDSDKSLAGSGPDRDIFFARSIDGGVTWSPAAPLNSNATTDLAYDYEPHLATDKNGTWIVVWYSFEDIDGTGADADIFYSKSADNGATWTAPSVLNRNGVTDTKDDRSPYIATDGEGRWVTVWESSDGLNESGKDRDIFHSCLTLGAHGKEIWSLPGVLNSNAQIDSENDRTPQVSSDGAGTWIATWVSTDAALGLGGDADVFFARSTDDGKQWSEMLPLDSSAASDDVDDLTPKIVADALGNWIAVWSSRYDYLGTGFDSDIFCSRSVDAGETWSNQIPLHENAFGWNQPDLNPQLATDNAGHWVAVWQSEEYEIEETFYDSIDIHVASSVDLDELISHVQVISPNGGEKWKIGRTKTIEWQSDAGNAMVKLDLLRDGEVVETIIESTEDDGAFEWQIPVSLAPGSGYRVRASIVDDPEASDESDGDFRIKHTK